MIHANRRWLNWGVFFVVLGSVPLAVRGGLVSPETAERAWTLWPILLIAGGAGILLRDTPARLVGGLVAAITFGLIGGGIVASGSFPVAGCTDDGETVAFADASGSLGQMTTVDVEMNCGSLTIDTAAGAGWRLAGTSPDNVAPIVEESSDSLRIRSPRSSASLGALASGQQWTLTLPTEPRLDLDVGLNAGEATLDLGAATFERIDLDLNAGKITADFSQVAALDEVNVSVNAGSVNITLPDRRLTGSMDVNAGDIRICAAATVAIRMVADSSVAAAYDFPGLVRTGDVYESPGFATATNPIELRVDANAGRITLDQDGGCDD